MTTLSSLSDVPDQSGRTAILTGGSSGIGRVAAAVLAAKGARVVVAVRDEARGRAAAASMAGDVEVRFLDLGDLASVREFARGINGPVDYLINNAGAMAATRALTADGFEGQFGVNHLGHFALTNLLLAQVRRRVVTVSSTAYRSGRIDFDDLQWERRPYRPWGAYGQSKLANLLFTSELQRRLDAVGSSVIAVAANPGWAATGFRVTSGHRLLDRLSSLVTPVLAQGPEGGALPTLLATVGDVPGDSFAAPSRLGGIRGPAALVERSAAARDEAAARRLWDVSEQLTGTRFPLVAGPIAA